MPLIPSRLARYAARLARDVRGVALIEFAYTLPLVAGIGMWGIELANYAIVHLKVSQIALGLADNASRVGLATNLATQQLREVDVNDVLQAARLTGSSIDVTAHGRITLSSLETNITGGQWIHWQRCAGLKSGTGWDSSYGVAGDGIIGNSLAGMGPADAKVTAPPNGGVMFVEINYEYQPIFSNLLVGSTKLSYIASFIVRDKRDFAGVFNPDPAATPSPCSAHAA